MRRIVITEEVDNDDSMVDLLKEIVRLIENGFTRGYSPDWYLVGQESFEEDNY